MEGALDDRFGGRRWDGARVELVRGGSGESEPSHGAVSQEDQGKVLRAIAHLSSGGTTPSYTSVRTHTKLGTERLRTAVAELERQGRVESTDTEVATGKGARRPAKGLRLSQRTVEGPPKDDVPYDLLNDEDVFDFDLTNVTAESIESSGRGRDTRPPDHP